MSISSARFRLGPKQHNRRDPREPSRLLNPYPHKPRSRGYRSTIGVQTPISTGDFEPCSNYILGFGPGPRGYSFSIWTDKGAVTYFTDGGNWHLADGEWYDFPPGDGFVFHAHKSGEYTNNLGDVFTYEPGDWLQSGGYHCCYNELCGYDALSS